MAELISQIRDRLPQDRSGVEPCTGDCQACSRKLVEYLEAELEGWEWRLAQGETPGLADLSRLARSGRKILGVLARNGPLDTG